jgi:hypothetical protein
MPVADATQIDPDVLVPLLSGGGGAGTVLLTGYFLIRSLLRRLEGVENRVQVQDAELASLRISHTRLESSLEPKICAMQEDIRDLKTLAQESIPKVLEAMNHYGRHGP